ncbi:DUF5615 family PIN-like protein [bacterium]|nr:DUF5615 family PIN-like protein [bacterium]
MRFLADENVDKSIVDWLRRDGYEVVYIAEISPSIPDDEVFEKANKLQAILLTADKDFGELVFRQGIITAGVVLLRLAGLTSAGKTEIVSRAVKLHGDKMKSAFTVITASAVRIREIGSK